MARSARGEKFRRIALYLPPSAAHRLDLEALARSDAAGVGLSSESTARALVYAGLGLSADGLRTVGAPAGGESDWHVMLRHVARAFGGDVVFAPGQATLLMELGTGERVCKVFAEEIKKHAPPPSGVVFEVKAMT